MHQGRVRCSSAWAEISWQSATPGIQNLRLEALQRCRLTVQISTKLNQLAFDHWRTGPDFALFGAYRARPASAIGRAIRERRGYYWCRPHTARRARTRFPRNFAVSRPSLRVSRRRRSGRRTTVNWDRLASPTSTTSATISRRVVPGLDQYNVRVRQPGGFYLPNSPPRGENLRRHRSRAKFTVHAIAGTRAGRRSAFARPPFAATTSSTLPSTVRTTAIVEFPMAGVSCF